MHHNNNGTQTTGWLTFPKLEITTGLLDAFRSKMILCRPLKRMTHRSLLSGAVELSIIHTSKVHTKMYKKQRIAQPVSLYILLPYILKTRIIMCCGYKSSASLLCLNIHTLSGSPKNYFHMVFTSSLWWHHHMAPGSVHTCSLHNILAVFFFTQL